MTINLQSIHFFKRLSGLLLLLIMGTTLGAQNTDSETIKVAQKTIEKTLPFAEGNKVYLMGQRANIRVSSWEKQEVKVVLTLKAKNANKDQAAKDLETFTYSFGIEDKKINIENTIPEEKSSSNLIAEYRITIPTYCPIDIQNHFGDMDIDKLASSVDVNSEYGTVRLTNIKGNVNVVSYFGDIEAQYISGNVNINSRRSDIKMANLTGVYDIKAEYALININAHPSLISMNIDAKKSDIFFDSPKREAFSYNLETNNGKIKVPDFMKFDFNILDRRTEAFSSGVSNSSPINIKTTFGKITIGSNAQMGY